MIGSVLINSIVFQKTLTPKIRAVLVPKLTPADIRFLIYAKVALRFQHSEYDKRFQEDGEIKGDAYSLSYPKKWHPPTEAKAAEFELELKKKVRAVLIGHMVSDEQYDGSFLLLKDVNGAREPVTDRAYEGPFFPVGAGTSFYPGQVIGRVEVSQDLVVNKLGFYRDRQNDEVLEKVVDHITDKIIDQIVQQRQQAADQIPAMEEDARKLTEKQDSWEQFVKLRRWLGQPDPPD